MIRPLKSGLCGQASCMRSTIAEEQDIAAANKSLVPVIELNKISICLFNSIMGTKCDQT